MKPKNFNESLNEVIKKAWRILGRAKVEEAARKVDFQIQNSGPLVGNPTTQLGVSSKYSSVVRANATHKKQNTGVGFNNYHILFPVMLPHMLEQELLEELKKHA